MENDNSLGLNEKPSNFELLKFYKDLLIQEQAFFWQRFTALAALQAGLIILSTSDTIDIPELFDLIGIILAALWLYIQIVSLWYVDRYKPEFHKLREKFNIDHNAPSVLSNPKFSSTNAALYVIVIILLLWILKLGFDMW